jgi:RNA polymerase sigma-70 factor (ECF subfamily)
MRASEALSCLEMIGLNSVNGAKVAYYPHRDLRLDFRFVAQISAISWVLVRKLVVSPAVVPRIISPLKNPANGTESTYRAGEPVLAWVYAIARHIRVDHYRKACRTAGREEPLERMPEPAAAPPAGAEKDADLETILAHLPESQREVIDMLKVAGMSLEEVARATSSSVGR